MYSCRQVRHAITTKPMITTITIEKLCLQEDGNAPDAAAKQERIDWIKQELDAGNYEAMEREFAWIGTERVRKLDSLQLACEALKFHQLCLSGLDLHQAMNRVLGP